MASTFAGFSEAAVLYAEYATVVETIRTRFLDDISGFLDAVRAEVGALLAPQLLQEKQTAVRYRYWWIADNAKEKDSHPQLWVDCRAPGIVKPGSLRLIGCAPQATPPVLRSLAAVAKDPKVQQYCTQGAGGTWSLFTINVAYAGDNLPAQAANPIALVLAAMHQVYLDCQIPRGKAAD